MWLLCVLSWRMIQHWSIPSRNVICVDVKPWMTAWQMIFVLDTRAATIDTKNGASSCHLHYFFSLEGMEMVWRIPVNQLTNGCASALPQSTFGVQATRKCHRDQKWRWLTGKLQYQASIKAWRKDKNVVPIVLGILEFWEDGRDRKPFRRLAGMCPDTFNTKEVDRNRNMVPIIVQKGSADEENKSGWGIWSYGGRRNHFTFICDKL